MPQFYFHIREPGLFVPDEEGMYLPDLKQAQQEAHRSCLDLLRNRVHGHLSGVGLRIEIADASGKIIDSVNVRDGFH